VRAMIPAMAHLLIAIRPAGKTEFETLGRCNAEPSELSILRASIREHANPLAAIDRLPPGLLRDTLEVCRDDGHEVRITEVP
jgi:hypothetical protein